MLSGYIAGIPTSWIHPVYWVTMILLLCFTISALRDSLKLSFLLDSLDEALKAKSLS
jgi:hypothetical protein